MQRQHEGYQKCQLGTSIDPIYYQRITVGFPSTSKIPMEDTTAVYRTVLVQYDHFSSTYCHIFLFTAVLGWFTGLSSKFLAARTARLLVLAGTDRLNTELMIGQMQGKFQMTVVPGVGHMLHEVCLYSDTAFSELLKDGIFRIIQLGLQRFW